MDHIGVERRKFDKIKSSIYVGHLYTERCWKQIIWGKEAYKGHWDIVYEILAIVFLKGGSSCKYASKLERDSPKLE